MDQTQTIAESDIIIEQLKDKTLPLEKVREIYEACKDEMRVVSMVAMNLSLRTSVYDPEKEKSPIMTELLVKLSKAADMSARWAVAKNPHTPPQILRELAKDPINLVRALVATNPNTPKDILSILFGDEKIVRDGLSGNPNTPARLLAVLADDSDKMVRLRVADNPSAGRDILTKLQGDADLDVSKAAEINLSRLAQ